MIQVGQGVPCIFTVSAWGDFGALQYKNERMLTGTWQEKVSGHEDPGDKVVKPERAKDLFSSLLCTFVYPELGGFSGVN